MSKRQEHPVSYKFTDLSPRAYNIILSDEGISVLDIVNLKQICRALRRRLQSVLASFPAIYRDKLVLLAERIPTWIPQDLSDFTSAQLEAAALRSYAVERAWRSNSPKTSGETQTYHASVDPGSDRPNVMALKVLPGGRWVISALQSGCITVWDTVEERIVAQDLRCENITSMAHEIIGWDHVRLAITCSLFDPQAKEFTPALAVYSLTLDPPPMSRQDDVLKPIGNAWSIEPLINPAIKGYITGATFYNHGDEVKILIYNWKQKAGNILKLDLRKKVEGDTFGISQSLVFLPGQVLLYRRWDHLAFLFAVNIPNLAPYTFDKDVVQPPARFDAVPCAVTKTDFKPRVDNETSRCNVLIAEAPSSPTSISLVTLTINTYEPRGIFCESINITSDRALKSLSVQSKLHFKRNLGSGSRHISIREADPYRPLFALGYSGKRAIWVEYSLDRGHGGLLGYTNPAEDDSTDDTSSYELDGEQEAQVFREAYPLRRLPTPGIESLVVDITAMGFDESTGVVALGDVKGQVRVFNYGPSNTEGEDDHSKVHYAR